LSRFSQREGNGEESFGNEANRRHQLWVVNWESQQHLATLFGIAGESQTKPDSSGESLHSFAGIFFKQGFSLLYTSQIEILD
jgi:hypothetical protein